MIVTDEMKVAALDAWALNQLVEPSQERMGLSILAALEASPGWLTKEELAALREQAMVEWHSPLLESAVSKINRLLGDR